MIATWSIVDSGGAVIASGQIREPMPADAAQAYEISMRVANAIEAGMLGYIGPAGPALPLLEAAE